MESIIYMYSVHKIDVRVAQCKTNYYFVWIWMLQTIYIMDVHCTCTW